MTQSRNRNWRILTAILVAVFVSTGGVAYLTWDLIGKLAGNADKAEHQRNLELVQSGFHANERAIGAMLMDNAYWDEAVRNSIGDQSKQYWLETWGMPTGEDYYPYNIVFIVNGDGDKVLAGYRGGTNFDMTIPQFFGGNFVKYKEMIRQSTDPKPVATGMVKSPFGPAIVAVAPITPLSKDVSPIIPNYYLVFVNVLSDATIAQIAKDYVVKDLRLKGMSSSHDETLPLRDAVGNVVAYAKWDDAKVGSTVANEVKFRAYGTIAMLLLVMSALAFGSWMLLQRILKNEAAAIKDALHDSLTGLSNRSALIAALKELQQNKKQDLTVAFADLDGFKDVNDSFGHQLGDQLIGVVAEGMKIIAKDAVIVCRMGGDEFVALFVGPHSVDQAKRFAEHLIAFVAKPFDFDGRLAAVGVSIGLASSDSENNNEEELMRCADIAMYRSKAMGKNRWNLFDISMDADRRDSKALAADLKDVLDRSALEIAFQPVVEAKSGKITSVEALARWPNSSPRQVAPDEFIRAAELSGQIDRLGEVILKKACQAAKAWGDLKMEINVSPLQLNDPAFCQRALGIIRASGIDPSRIGFEITETILIHDMERTRRVLDELRNAGFRIVLDDFGSGYSSIGYLTQFKFDRIKIDRSIVSRILTGTAELSMVQGIVLLARGLSADVTAEGVESAEEVAMLRLTGCTELQGFYFHRPMSAQALGCVLVEQAQHPFLQAIPAVA